MADSYSLVIGTTNVAKGRELAELLAPHGFAVQTLADFPPQDEVVEDGDTFAANARKKASEYARRLGGVGAGRRQRPRGGGARRAAGRVLGAVRGAEDATDAANNAKLLEELGDLPPEKRGADTCATSRSPIRRAKSAAETSDICTRADSHGAGGDERVRV